MSITLVADYSPATNQSGANVAIPTLGLAGPYTGLASVRVTAQPTTGQTGAIVSIWDHTSVYGSQLLALANVGGVISFIAYGPTFATVASSSLAPASTTWYHVAWGRDAGNHIIMRVFADDANLTKLSDDTAAATDAQAGLGALTDFNVGGGAGVGSFGGQVRGVRFFDGPYLTDAECRAEFRSDRPVKTGATAMHGVRVNTLDGSTAGLHCSTGPQLMTLQGAGGYVPSYSSQEPTYGYTAPFASDDFNRADGSAGANWFRLSANPNLTIVSNAGLGDQAGDGGSTWQTAPTFLDQWAEIVVKDATLRGVGPMVRGRQASGQGGYTYDPILGSATQGAIINEQGTSILADRAAGTWAAGDVARIEALGASPTTVRAYRNGVQVGADYADSIAELQQIGELGIHYQDTTHPNDSWAAGRVGPTPVPTPWVSFIGRRR